MHTKHEPYKKFCGYLCEHDMTYADVANIIGKSKRSVSGKINGSSDFYSSEIDALIQACPGLTLNFFYNNVSKTETP